MKPAVEAARVLFDKYRGLEGCPSDLEGLDAELRTLPLAEQKTVRASLVKFADIEIRKIERERGTLVRARERLEKQAEEIKALMDDWLDKPAELQRPGASCLHHLRQAIADGNAFMLNRKLSFSVREFGDVLSESNCFVVEHDWAKAFTGAADFAEGDIRLPYETCAFDFKIGGRRVVALMTTDADSSDVLMQIMVRGRDLWMIDDDICRHRNGAWSPIGSGRTPEGNTFQRVAEFIGAQVRAITIALDAQVAESEVVRVNEKLARSREKSGHIPPKPYHIVSLAHRSRAAPLAPSGEPEHGKKRMHFRRGHWRHYEDHKTWIRWMLVGNPDLGFVDKEYRL